LSFCNGSNLSKIIFTIASASSPDSLLIQFSINWGVHAISPPAVSTVPVNFDNPKRIALNISGFLISSGSFWSSRFKANLNYLPGYRVFNILLLFPILIESITSPIDTISE
jgi:hypothetical protein